MTRRTGSLILASALLSALPLVVSIDGANGAAIAASRSCLDEEFPRLLSETGFYESIPEKRFSASMIPYEVNSSFWNDGAKKQRHMRLPEGKKARFIPDGPWEFPDGTVFALTLFLENGGERLFVETRVIRLHGDHLHFGTYTWNQEQTDAVLTPRGDEIYANVGDTTQLWEIADVADCFECHNESSRQFLGVKTSQLNKEIVVDGKRTSQLSHLATQGVVEGLPADLMEVARQADPMDETAALENRARSYLDTNCASCHRPGGNGSGTLDLRLETPMHLSGAIRLDGAMNPRAGVLVPGHGRRSRLVGRMRRIGGMRMPNLLSTVPDDRGIELITRWIDER